MFLNPWLLLGMSAVGIPVLLHLLNQRKFEPVVWAAMRFVKISLDKNRRRMQIEDLILLALRCLVVALFALALARPVLRHAAGALGRGPVTAMIVLDNSYSMATRDGAATRFDLARQAADEVLSTLPQGSSAGVLLVSDVVREIIPRPTADLALVRQQIRQTTLSDRATNLLPGLERAMQTLAGLPALPKEIFLITDGQALGWRQGSGAGGTELHRLLEDNRDTVSCQVLLVGAAETHNLAISRVHLATELPTVGKALRFEVEVTNEGMQEVRNVPVRLYVDAPDDPAAAETTPPVEEAMIDAIPGRSSRSVALHAKMRTDGYHAVTARLPTDALSADDARSLVVRTLQQVQVLLVNGESGREGREEDVYFLREALQPVPQAMRGEYFIQTRTIPAADLENTSLDSFDALVLANVADLTPAAEKGIERFLSEGRGLVVFPGPNTNTAYYNEVLFRQRGLLPLALGEAQGDSGQAERFLTLQTSRFEHPITAFWNDEGRGNMGVAHFFRRYPLEAGEPQVRRSETDEKIGPASVLLRYADGSPAAVEHTWGVGRVVLFGSTANTQWNDFPVRASVFVPLMHRVLSALVERQDEHLNVAVGERFIARCGVWALGRDAQITRPGKRGGVPDSARVELSGPWPTLTYDGAETGGVYRVRIAGAEGEADGQESQMLFAAQANIAESDLSSLTADERARLKPVAGFVDWKPGVALSPAAAMAAAGTELWWYLALAVLTLAIAEAGLAHWFSRSK